MAEKAYMHTSQDHAAETGQILGAQLAQNPTLMGHRDSES